VKRDYYAVLGVSPTSEHVVIQAAYRALMRRYHPDADPSVEAAERAQAVNAAYAVLGDPDKRARYDGSLAAQRLIKPETVPSKGLARRLMQAAVAMAGLAVFIAAAVFLAKPQLFGVLPEVAVPASVNIRSKSVATDNSRIPASTRNTGLCDDPVVAGLIKAELLRQAAAMPEGDRGAVQRILGQSALRLASPSKGLVDSTGVASCSAGASLDLPAGLVSDAGRTNLNAQLGYSVSKDDQRVRLLGLNGTGRLLRSLATLGPAPDEIPAIDLIPPHEGIMARRSQQ